MPNRSFSLTDFKKAVKKSRSIRQVLINLKLAPFGGNYGTVHRLVKELKLNTAHWVGQGHGVGRSHGKRTLSQLLRKNTIVSTYAMKMRLIKQGKLEKRCSKCRRITWLGEPIPLELDHKNGEKTDFRFSNLRLLCPNCHTKTPTYRGKKLRKPRVKCTACTKELCRDNVTGFCGHCLIGKKRPWPKRVI